MSCTDAALGWLLSLPATCSSSPFRDDDLTDWLHLSPYSSPPLQDVSSSARVNHLHYDYGLSSSPDLPTSAYPAIFNQHHRMVSLDSTTTTLFDSPIPRSFSFFSPSGTLMQPHLESLPQSSLFSSPAPKFTEELEKSPFSNLYYDLASASLPPSTIFDVSPVVRADKVQEYLMAKDKPAAKPKKKKRRTRQAQTQPSSFVDRLRSAPTLVDDQACLPSKDARPASTSTLEPTLTSTLLMSPCKLFAQPEPLSLSASTTPPMDDTSQMTPAPIFTASPSLPAPTDELLSPLTPLTSSSSPHRTSTSQFGIQAKRPTTDPITPPRRSKRPRRTLIVESSPLLSPVEASPEYIQPQVGEEEEAAYTNRTLPNTIEISNDFPLFYRRFPVSAYHRLLNANLNHPGGTYNSPRSMFDLYTPRFVRGKGVDKVGLCPICVEPAARGGENKNLWLAMKFSAFKCYHMQYAHGISASTGRPFSPPTAFRIVLRPNPGKKEKHQIQQGRCHKCAKWVPVEGIKDMGSKVPELHWWKHAATCHHDSALEGEGDYYEEDETYSALVALTAVSEA